MTVEDQLRAAGRAVSEQVRDLPRLDLRTQPTARHAQHFMGGAVIVQPVVHGVAPTPFPAVAGKQFLENCGRIAAGVQRHCRAIDH